MRYAALLILCLALGCAEVKVQPAATIPPGQAVSVVGEVQYEKEIGDLKVGEWCYTTPWAYDPVKGVLRLSYTAHRESHGTVTMLVARTQDGYEIHIPPNEKYSRNRFVHMTAKVEDNSPHCGTCDKAKSAIKRLDSIQFKAKCDCCQCEQCKCDDEPAPPAETTTPEESQR